MKWILIVAILSFPLFGQSQIFKGKCIMSGISNPNKSGSLMPSACAELIVYDNSLQRIYIYKSPEEKYDLIAYINGKDKAKDDSSITLYNYQGVDKDNVKCSVILGMSEKGIERLSILYQNLSYIYVIAPLD